MEYLCWKGHISKVAVPRGNQRWPDPETMLCHRCKGAWIIINGPFGEIKRRGVEGDYEASRGY